MGEIASKSLIVATAGHIDHGKSTLIEALTGTDPDRLPDEKRRQMTIELGFASLELPGLHIGIVDVPGHADFVRNMVSGVGNIDAALFVVASDDVWMPQTEEHLQILLYLGVTKAIIALTKSDLLTDRDLVFSELRDRLLGTPFVDASIVPVCALGGDGLDELRFAMHELLQNLPFPEDKGKPRLFVDRAFSPKGVGTVATGTLTGGRLCQGDAVRIQPYDIPAKIRGIQNHGHVVNHASPGMRTAINLGATEIAKEGSMVGIRRGSVVLGPEVGGVESTDKMHVLLQRIIRPTPGNFQQSPVLKSGQMTWIHHGTTCVEARVLLVDCIKVNVGEQAFAELHLKSPIVAFQGDRFIVRDVSKRFTLAGGIILEPFGGRLRARSPSQRRYLQEIARDPNDAAMCLQAQLRKSGYVDTRNFLRASHCSHEAIEQSLLTLEEAERFGHWVIDKAKWRMAIASAESAIDDFHRKRPADEGMKISNLRLNIQTLLPDQGLFEPLLEALVEKGFGRLKSLIVAPGFIPKLPPAVRQARLRLLMKLENDYLNPLKLSHYVETEEDKQALSGLVQSGKVIMLNSENAMLLRAYNEAKERIILYLNSVDSATVSQLKEALGGTGRRIMVPLCERLDREGITRRHGDMRSLAKPSKSK